MRYISFLLLLLVSGTSYGQNMGGGGNGGNNPSTGVNNNVNEIKTASVQGTIGVPRLQALDVAFTVNNFHMQFDQWNQLDDGREYPGALRVHVKSNTPWVVKIKSNDVYQQPTGGGSANVPASLINIKPYGGVYTPLTTSYIQVLTSMNNNIENTYYLDLKIGYNYNDNYRGDRYNLNVAFSLSAP